MILMTCRKGEIGEMEERREDCVTSRQKKNGQTISKNNNSRMVGGKWDMVIVG